MKFWMFVAQKTNEIKTKMKFWMFVAQKTNEIKTVNRQLYLIF